MNQNRPFPSPEVMTGRLRCRGDDDPRAVETDKNLRRLHAIPHETRPCAKAKTRR